MALIEYWMDFGAPVMLFVVFLFTAPWGRKIWWMADTYASFTFGLGLVFIPDTIAGFQFTKPLDASHHLILRQIGIVMMGISITFFLCRRSTDDRMFGAHLFSRVVGLTLFLLIQLTSYYHTSQKKTGLKFNDKYLYFACTGVGFWLLGSAIQLLRYRRLGGYVHHSSCLQFILYLDNYLLCIAAFVAFTFPSNLLKLAFSTSIHVDAIHMTLTRNVAALWLARSLASLEAGGFLHTKDKKAQLAGRLAVCLAECIGQLVMNALYIWLFKVVKLTVVTAAVAFGPLLLYSAFLAYLLQYSTDGQKKRTS